MNLLYKYVTAERVLTCLPEIGDGTLRATQPSALNDPFEAAVQSGFVEPEEGEGNRRLAKVLTSIQCTSPVSESDVQKARTLYGSLYLRELLTTQLSQRFGVVSFSRNPKHPLMWSHYTMDGSGFVVGYDCEHLKRLSHGEDCLRPVIYRSSPEIILGYEVLNEENKFAMLSPKSDHWRYEDEWRLIVELKDTIGTGHQDRRGQPINLIRVPNQAVRSVYYTERTSKDTVFEVIRRLQDPNNRYCSVEPIKLIMSKTQYGYEKAAEQPNRLRS